MAQFTDQGITVIESPDRHAAVSIEASGRTAFLGRTLRGPVNVATIVRSSGEFRRIYGEDLSDSHLAASVSQFFSHGGYEAVIVRLVNHARGTILSIPCPDGMLQLLARDPGSGEILRAAIDYDGLADDEARSFNLSLQRLSGSTKRMLDQEIHQNVSLSRDSSDFIEARLQSSKIASCLGASDFERPLANATGVTDAYYSSCVRGSDGRVLTDYDLVGSARNASGLFALDEIDDLDFIYIPPEPDDLAPGPILAAAAARYALERQAIVIMDPMPKNSGVGAFGRTPNILTYDRRPDLRAGPRQVPVGGALAGLLADAAKRRPPAGGLSDSLRKLSRQFVLRDSIDAVRASKASLMLRTAKDRLEFEDRALLCSELTDDRLSLADLRLLLQIQRQLLKTTRWCLFEKSGASLWHRLEQQVGDYLKALAQNDCIENQDWYVQCDAVTNTGCLQDKRQVRCVLSFRCKNSELIRVFTLEQSTERGLLGRSSFVSGN